MSVEQTKTIDVIGIDKATGKVVLTVSDHLDWHSEEEHLLLLQDKLNSYLAFIESGEIEQSYPNAKGKQIRITVRALHEPTRKAFEFLASAQKIIGSAGFEFRFEQTTPQSLEHRCE